MFPRPEAERTSSTIAPQPSRDSSDSANFWWTCTGPHDHQSLLNQDFQLDILDAFGHTKDTRAAYQDAYRHMLDIEQQRRELEGDDQTMAQQIDMLKFQVQEIKEADLDGLDEDELDQEHATAANAQRILELADGLQRALTEDDASTFNSMAFVCQAADELADLMEAAQPWREEANAINVQIQELSSTIANATQSIDADPSRLQWLDDRMTLIHKLKRKYGTSVSDILAFREQAQDKLTDLETRGERMAQLDSEWQGRQPTGASYRPTTHQGPTEGRTSPGQIYHRRITGPRVSPRRFLRDTKHRRPPPIGPRHR